MLEKVKKFLRYLNGNLVIQRCAHVCDGTCCKSPEDSKELVFLALVEIGILLGESGLPAAHKWGSMTGSCSEVSAGLLIHGIFPRAFRKAFPDYNAGAIEAIGDELVEEAFSYF